ncbi:MAG TPA: hypothetical protein VNZ25_03305, partial [Candidatus Angelobacter sp.]|nr:hypothetical protein [Candidatus Angelobacter sp.]
MFFIRQPDGKVFGLSFARPTHQEGMSQHQGERDDRSLGDAGRDLHFDNPSFNIHDQQHLVTTLRAPWGETPPGVITAAPSNRPARRSVTHP